MAFSDDDEALEFLSDADGVVVRDRERGTSMRFSGAEASKLACCAVEALHASMSAKVRKDLIGEVTRLFRGAHAASVLAKAIGIPVTRIPVFRTAELFWASVVEEAEKGAVHRPLNAIVTAALERHPTNTELLRIKPLVLGR